MSVLSEGVRSAVVWVGLADPLKTQEKLREEDPERVDQLELMEAWKEASTVPVQTHELIALAMDAKYCGCVWEDVRPRLKAAVMRVAAPPGKSQPEERRLGNYLRAKAGR